MLVRHGQTDWNLQGRYQGRSDVPLNATGREQAERLAAGLATGRLEAVYSSPLGRCLETARLIARAQGLEPVPDPRLIEIDQGEWEGMLAVRIAEGYPEVFRRWLADPLATRPPGGESIGEVHDRVVAAVEEMSRSHPGGSLCVVTHKTPIVVLRCHYLGMELRDEMGRMPEHATWELIRGAPHSSAPLSPAGPCCSARFVS